MHALGEFLRLAEVGRGRLEPEHVDIRRVAQSTGDRLIDPRPDTKESFRRSFTGEECVIALVYVAREEGGRVGIGAGDEHRRHSGNISREAASVRCAIAVRVGTRTLPPIWPHFFSLAS